MNRRENEVAESEKKLVKQLVKSGARSVCLISKLGFIALSSEYKCNAERVKKILGL
jgi:hypothetical protein